MIEFLQQSKMYAGITFQGMFTAQDHHIQLLYDHYMETSENLLDVYVRIVQYSWDAMEADNSISKDDVSEVLHHIRKPIFKNIFTIEKIHAVRQYLYYCSSNYSKWKYAVEDTRRKEASRYIQKKDIRQWVFDTYGKKCLCCGGEDKISVDHIVPVSKGGLDDKGNLQPLCTSCNSRKNNQIIDYRK